jgi:nitroreductase
VAGEVTVFDVLDTARSMRWLKEEPVERELLERLIWAGTRASNPGNSQHWDFVVVTSPELKKRVKEAIIGQRGGNEGGARSLLPADPVERRTMLGAQNLIRTLDTAPALIFVCAANLYPTQAPVLEWAYSAMHAAAQNILIAARYLGLGAAFTTLHQQVQPEIREILGIPEDRIIGVTIPIGWPARPFGPVTRRPVQDVVHWDVW